MLLLVVLKRCDFTCNSRGTLGRVLDVCKAVASEAETLKTKSGVDNQPENGECV